MVKLPKNSKLDKILRQAEQAVKLKARKAATFSCSFDKRRAGVTKQECVIYCSLIYGKRSIKFSTGVRSGWNKFDLKTGVILNRPDLTVQLGDIKHRAEQLYANLLLTERTIELEVIKAAIRGEYLIIDDTPDCIGCIEKYIKNEEERFKAKQIVKRTKWKNIRWSKDFIMFIIFKYGKYARLDQLKPRDIRAFALWLQNNRPAPLEKLGNNTAESTASHAKVILNFALDNEWVERNPFINFRRKLDRVERVTLTQEEIKRFVSMDLVSQSLAFARDIFFFMTLTGLNYCDVEKLTTSDIHQTSNGQKYISHRRRKTDEPAYIPLRIPALLILSKYWSNDASKPLLMLPRNAPLNRSIRQIAHMAGLTKTVTTKVARNSLATFLLNSGVPISSIAAILGHSSIVTTQKYYAKIDPETVINDIRAMEERGDQDENN